MGSTQFGADGRLATLPRYVKSEIAFVAIEIGGSQSCWKQMRLRSRKASCPSN